MILGLMVVGCGEGGEITIGEPSKAKPVKKLTLKESVVGSYEGGIDVDGDSVRIVLLKNGVLEFYANDEKALW